MTEENVVELIQDLQNALSKALNGKAIREYDHLQSRCEIAIKEKQEDKVCECIIPSTNFDRNICFTCLARIKPKQ